ncbi:MAG TPA: RNA polymerase sigma factor [Planctomycetota bacterium]|nr:RNA polymerase sigma factor [Planctomycetota bacterium]
MHLPSTMWTCIRQASANPALVTEMVVSRYQTPLLEFARQQGLTHEDAEEVVQEAFVRICKEEFLLKADRAKGKFRSLLLAVLKYVISEFRRHRNAGVRDRRLEVPLGTFDVPAEIPEDAGFNRLWVKNLVRQAFENLKGDPTVESLRLQMDGMSYKDIATTQGIRETDVTNNIHRAKPRIKRELEKLIGQYSTQDECPDEIALLIQYL